MTKHNLTVAQRLLEVCEVRVFIHVDDKAWGIVNMNIYKKSPMFYEEELRKIEGLKFERSFNSYRYATLTRFKYVFF